MGNFFALFSSTSSSPSTSSPASVTEILDFWFLPTDHPDYGKDRSCWFKKDSAFDDEIRAKFGAIVERALKGELKEEWNSSANSGLAHIILLDQFTRNIFRDSPKSFAGDEIALACSKSMIAEGLDASMHPTLRCFLYTPFMHSEERDVQEQGVELFNGLVAQTGKGGGNAIYAQKHLDVIKQFNRFPHRNKVLGRVSTAAEEEYLANGGGF